MFADDELTDLEKKMLQAIEREWDRWEESGAPLPMPLVTLMRSTHEALLKRANKMAGDSGLIARDPEAALLRVERVRQNILRQIQQKQEGKIVS